MLRSDLPDAGEVASLLAQRIAELAHQLFPNGRREGHEWRVGSLSGEPGTSLGVRLTGSKAGWWKDFSTDEGGDALSLVTVSRCGGDRAAGWRWALDWLGLRSDGLTEEDLQRIRREAETARREAEAREERDRRQRARRAKALWLSGAPLAESPAAAYLAGRALPLSRFPRPSRALRFGPEVFDGRSQKAWPALLAAMTDDAGEIVACHRTFLAPKEDGGWTKAPLEKAKTILGPMSGAAIRLQRGATGRPWNEIEAGEHLAIGEGIENVLSLSIAKPQWRTIAAGSLGNLGRISIPQPVRLSLIADNDPGDAQREALESAAAAYRAAGHDVRILRAPEPHKDFNDWLQDLARG